jgi:two-component system, sensor histidine kinase and response regulator
MDQTPALDAAHLDALRRLGPPPDGVLPELAALFLRDAPADLAELASAVAAGDRPTAARIAHRLKGMGGHIGAARLAAAASALEGDAAEVDGPRLDGPLARVRTAFDEVTAVLVRV